MKYFRRSVFTMMSVLILTTSCSKSGGNDETPVVEPEENTSPATGSKTTSEVMQKLIHNFKGTDGAVILEAEVNDISFGIDFTSSKVGKISKIRAFTGKKGDFYIKLWRKTGQQNYESYKSTSVTTTDSTAFSGDIAVDGWDIDTVSTYRMAIRIVNKVARLSSGTAFSTANASIGPIKFNKEFYWARNSSQASDIVSMPYEYGNYKHFAGFFDFDFVED